MSRIPKLIQRVTLLAIVLVAGNVSAFESWEHKRLGDLAYHVARAFFCNRSDLATSALCSKESEGYFFNPLLTPSRNTDWFESPPGKLTYGDVVMCVDFHLSPDKLLAFLGESANSMAGQRRYGTAIGDVLPSDSDNWGLNGPRDCPDSLANLRGNQASHVNHNHFQRELVSTLRIYHLLGISLARDERNLFGGLVANAISDHYLNDFFAPGHQVTPRSLLTDLFANAMHDKVNRTGLHMYLDTDKANLLVRERLCELAKEPYSDCEKGKLDLDDSAYFYLLRGCDSSKDDRCLCKEKEWKHCVNENAKEEVSQAFRDLLAVADRGGSINVFGDDLLWSGSRRDSYDKHSRQSLQQRLLMLAYQVASIRDVIWSTMPQEKRPKSPPRSTNSLQLAGWNTRMNPHEGGLHFIDAILPGLAYRVEIGMPISDASKEQVQGQAQTTAPSAEPAKPPSNRDSLGPYATYSPVVGASFSRDAMLFGDNLGRKVFSLETVPLGTLSFEKATRNWGLAVGYHRFWEGKVEGFGWGVRPTWVLPETETMVGLSIRRLKHPDANGPGKWRNSFALRVDQGFTSFLTFFMQMGPDYATQRDGRIGSGWSFSAGVQLAAPVTRIPGIKQLGAEE